MATLYQVLLEFHDKSQCIMGFDNTGSLRYDRTQTAYYLIETLEHAMEIFNNTIEDLKKSTFGLNYSLSINSRSHSISFPTIRTYSTYLESMHIDIEIMARL